jgi:small subunit ribosomal protein S16
MVVIRLTRGGAKKRPFYHIVATDKRSRRDGRFIERIGFYNPVAAANENGLVLSMDRVGHWQQQGAQLSPTVARLVKQYQANPVPTAGQASASQAAASNPAATPSPAAEPSPAATAI